MLRRTMIVIGPHHRLNGKSGRRRDCPRARGSFRDPSSDTSQRKIPAKTDTLAHSPPISSRIFGRGECYFRHVTQSGSVHGVHILRRSRYATATVTMTTRDESAARSSFPPRHEVDEVASVRCARGAICFVSFQGRNAAVTAPRRRGVQPLNPELYGRGIMHE